jgi:hypothetical protein
MSGGGFKRNRTLYELVFTDEDMRGLVVVMKSLPIAGLLRVTRLAAKMTGDSPDLTEVDEMFRVFADCLVSWNLEDDIGDVPTDYDGVASQDLDFITKIITAWMEKVGGGVDPTSLPGSSNGATSEEAPPPGLANASTSLRNSPKQS